MNSYAICKKFYITVCVKMFYFNCSFRYIENYLYNNQGDISIYNQKTDL